MVSARFEPEQWDEAGKWYWQVMRQSFPEARYFTVLRHPCDVAISARKHWGYDEASIWWSLAFMAALLTHPDSLVKYAVVYEDLVADKRRVTEELFAFLELPFFPEVLEAFNQAHAASPGRSTPDAAAGARTGEWGELAARDLSPFYREHIARLFEKFSCPLRWPDHFDQKNDEPEIPAGETQSESREAELHRTIEKLNRKIGDLHLEFGEKMRRREEELRELYIGELKKAGLGRALKNSLARFKR